MKVFVVSMKFKEDKKVFAKEYITSNGEGSGRAFDRQIVFLNSQGSRVALFDAEQVVAITEE